MINSVQYTVKQLCEIMEVELPEEYESVENEIVTNISSEINYLYKGGAFILYGKRGKVRREKLMMALEKKPKFVIAGNASKNIAVLRDIPHVIVEDAYEAMVKISGRIRNELSAKIIGVTGSLGKTTTKELVYHVLKQEYCADKNQSNRNNTRGILCCLQKIDRKTEFYVQEFSVAMGTRSMERKVHACLPDAAIITNISDAHIGILGSRENILKEKIKLVTEMPEGCPAFLNYDDELLKNITLEKHPIISFAVENKEADYYAEDIDTASDCLKFSVVHGERKTPVVMHAAGLHNIGNAVVAMAVGEWAGVPLDKIVSGIASFRTRGIRQTLTEIGGYHLYIDCYNSAPVSLIGAVKTLERLQVAEKGKRIAVIGEMRELGDFSERLHIEAGEAIGQSDLDMVICFGGENAKCMARTIRKYDKAVLYTDDRDELNNWLTQFITRKDIALFKGSHALMLYKSIDQVYGTAFHFSEGYRYRCTVAKNGEYSFKIISEEDVTKQTVAIKQYWGKDTKVVLPNRYGETSIGWIASKAFRNNTVIEDVCIQEPIIGIGKYAFAKCQNLKRVVLPGTLKTIESGAFANCKSLEELTIPESVIEIGKDVFAGCDRLKIKFLNEYTGALFEMGNSTAADKPGA